MCLQQKRKGVNVKPSLLFLVRAFPTRIKKKKKPVIELCVRHKLRNFVRVRVTFFFFLLFSFADS